MKQAILAVSFGTSYLDTLDKTVAATERALFVRHCARAQAALPRLQ